MTTAHSKIELVRSIRKLAYPATDAEESRRTEESRPLDDVTWSQSLAGAINAQAQTVFRLAPDLGGPASTRWHEGDADLTNRHRSSAPAPDRSEPSERDLKGITLEADAGRLGPISIRIQETPRGLSLTISLRKAGATPALLSTLPDLLESLNSLGMKVASVKIKEPNGPGTTLALLGGAQPEPRLAAFHSGINIVG